MRADEYDFDFERRQTWRKDAACRDEEIGIFFPSFGQSLKKAKEICNACPVREQCLRYALYTDEEFGVWGGMSPIQRERIAGNYTKEEIRNYLMDPPNFPLEDCE